MTQDVQLTIDGQTVTATTGETLLDAARRHGIHIPTLCHVNGLTPLDTCMVCVVELRGRPGLVPSCATRAAAGMEVLTTSESVLSARRGAVELLFSEHMGECDAPCEIACPAGLSIADFMRLLPLDAPSAARLALRELALPTTLGWICNAPCERACRRETLDRELEIRALHRGVGPATDLAVAPASGKTVAVVGSGPAGLAAAVRLGLLGHACTLFEKEAHLGGSLRAIDAAQLPPAALDADLEVLQRLGVVLRLGTSVGGDAAGNAVLASFDAVVLALGADGAASFPQDPRYFVAGAAAGHGGLAVRVVADGLAKADAVDRLLTGKAPPPASVRSRYGELDAEESAFLYRDARGDGSPALLDGDAAAARAEAARCLDCGCAGREACNLRTVGAEVGAVPKRYAGEHRTLHRDASHPDLVYEAHKCILCQACVQLATPTPDHVGLTVAGRGFEARIMAPFDRPLAEALDAETARRIAEVCPTSAMRPKKVP